MLKAGTKRPWVGKEKTPSAPRMPADAAEFGKKKAFQFFSLSRKNGAVKSFVSRPDA
jgi:hypothetical protein